MNSTEIAIAMNFGQKVEFKFLIYRGLIYVDQLDSGITVSL